MKSRQPINRLCFYLMGLLLISPVALGAARPTIVFNCALPPSSPLMSILIATYSEAFDALGYDFKMLHLPSKRGLAQVKTGKIDGECGRLKELTEDEEAHSIVRVDAKLGTRKLVLVTYNPDLVGIQPASLFNSHLRIGSQLGNFAVDRLITRADESLNLHFVAYNQGFNMLKAGRIDFVACLDIIAESAIEELQLNPAPLIAAELKDMDVYPYLAQHRAELALPLARELNRILSNPSHPLKLKSL